MADVYETEFSGGRALLTMFRDNMVLISSVVEQVYAGGKSLTLLLSSREEYSKPHLCRFH